MTIYAYTIICKNGYPHGYQYLSSSKATLEGMAEQLDKYGRNSKECRPHRLITLRWDEEDSISKMEAVVKAARRVHDATFHHGSAEQAPNNPSDTLVRYTLEEMRESDDAGDELDETLKALDKE